MNVVSRSPASGGPGDVIRCPSTLSASREVVMESFSFTVHPTLPGRHALLPETSKFNSTASFLARTGCSPRHVDSDLSESAPCDADGLLPRAF